MNISKFFKDSSGRVVLAQFPSWPIWLIFGLSITQRVLAHDYRVFFDWAISLSLLYWGVLEITSGVNGFRRSLGVLGIGYAVMRLLQ